MHAESRYKSLPYDEAVLHNIGANLIALKEESNYFGVIGHMNEEPAGFMIGQVSNFYFTKDTRVASDLAIFVAKQYRGRAFGIVRMINMFEKWAAKKGAYEVQLGISTELETDRTEEMYNRLGYMTYGRLTRKEI